MTIAISDIDLYEMLKVPLGEQEAKTLVNFVESKVENGFQARIDTYATKNDISLVKKDIAQLEVKMAQGHANIIKWMFIFWIGQIAAAVALVKLL